MAVLLFELGKLLQVMCPKVHVVIATPNFLLLGCKVKINLSQLLESFFRKERALLALLEELEVRSNIHHPPTQLWVIAVATRNSAVAVAFFEEIQILHERIPKDVRGGLSGNINSNVFLLVEEVVKMSSTPHVIDIHGTKAGVSNMTFKDCHALVAL